MAVTDENEFPGESNQWHGGKDLFVNLSLLVDHKHVKKDKPYDVFVTFRNAPRAALAILEKSCNVHILPLSKVMPRYAEIRLSQMMHGIYTDGSIKMDAEFFQRTAPYLKVICVIGHDVSFIDLRAAKKYKIKIGVSGCASVSCGAEVAITLAIFLGRHLRDHHILAPSANWGEIPGQSLNESVVGIVGLGRLGMAIARKLFAFRPLCIAYYSRRAKKYAESVCAERVLLEDLIEQCDFIFLCCPCSLKTQNMFRESVFVKMKPTSIIINMSHGGLVELDDLFCALKRKKIAGFGMDAGIPNPPPFVHPIYRLPNFVVTGRLGERSVKAQLAMSVLAARDLVAALKDRPMVGQYQYEVPEVETEEERCIRKQQKALAACRAQVQQLLEEKRRLKEERKKKKGDVNSVESLQEDIEEAEEESPEVGEESEENEVE